eukprot:TRINITY_DN3736_c0_g1_i3.p1 TRINITY_DN3736_c0_g1~~TRINITY_DN3736_c0_g1_i3.p1  ORF type:complete len:228 (+),score=28.77 TRINITY_DN3736_c0_g1_i3:225-908(+)
MASFSQVPIAEPVADTEFLTPGSHVRSHHSNLPGKHEPFWKIIAGLAIGSLVCACLVFLGTSAGYVAGPCLIINFLAAAATWLAGRQDRCVKPMLVVLVITLTTMLLAIFIACMIESIRLHIATTESIYKCPCDLKLSNDQCQDKASHVHHQHAFNCFHADDSMCLLCTGSGAAQVGVSTVFMWLGWVQQLVICGYTFFVLCCYVSPNHPFISTGPTVVMGMPVPIA